MRRWLRDLWRKWRDRDLPEPLRRLTVEEWDAMIAAGSAVEFDGA